MLRLAPLLLATCGARAPLGGRGTSLRPFGALSLSGGALPARRASAPLVLCAPAATAPPAVALRRLERSDIWAASALLAEVFSSELGPVQRQLVQLEHVVGIGGRHGRTALFVAEERRGGRSRLEYLSASLPPGSPAVLAGRLKPYVASLAVRQAARGRGLGAELVRACEAAAAGKGQRIVQIQVESTNEVALRLYARLGYRVVAMDTRARKLVGDVFFGESVLFTKLTLEKTLGGDAT
ncbi:hypothetical protein EMIHUDRAFT_121584 [Emiliania huxleyi CCMP1516]|uniref:N-acetyltransferase domain-containing protein n=2 Tax=Emiliania huxleyi TaxID=2903 RepID=A0A0D3I038_EMIH1|nr:hypothetical protein EMIHUDRAFT_121584 [Emiliania huxleyi CCMP1516]EOD04623.1 hypothetical protein EMIHUDRAFT_121584 [Emiliania huxleyi CCMP1516]|eukprot:XP_005757052.1 hypothetical protein EMIHUDRAFT_121584 [Emiliania huxleyi CCMP1516]